MAVVAIHWRQICGWACPLDSGGSISPNRLPIAHDLFVELRFPILMGNQ